ncbi:membrane protein [Arthrobacter phage VResidence]|uniref:Membrane protein n=1 Tax=Arthrobacter phage VResidence TaxID=2927294 RepID=A0A9X9P6M4_9CAUD|nr:membrane protein [Arthrobacter phage VResidence]
MGLTPLDGFYLAIGQISASILYTAAFFALLFLICYICAVVETRHEDRARRNRKDSRNA